MWHLSNVMIINFLRGMSKTNQERSCSWCSIIQSSYHKSASDFENKSSFQNLRHIFILTKYFYR